MENSVCVYFGVLFSLRVWSIMVAVGKRSFFENRTPNIVKIDKALIRVSGRFMVDGQPISLRALFSGSTATRTLQMARVVVLTYEFWSNCHSGVPHVS